jgi:hypothetical protein
LPKLATGLPKLTAREGQSTNPRLTIALLHFCSQFGIMTLHASFEEGSHAGAGSKVI